MRKTIRLVLGIMILGLSAGWTAEERQLGVGPAGVIPLSAPRLDPDFGRMPLSFIPNRGQLDRKVEYYVAGRDKSVFFSAEGVTLALTRKDLSDKATSGGKPEAGSSRTSNGQMGETSRWAVKLDFVGADPNIHPAGEEKTETIVSYFKGSHDNWQEGIPTYSRIVYRDLWPGIDLAYSGTTERLKYEFVVQPGADPSAIRLAYRGVRSVAVNKKGQLEVETPVGGFRDERPLAYQERDGEKIAVRMAFRLEDRTAAQDRESLTGGDPSLRPFVYGFEVGDYDRSLPLVLDPATVIYCGFIGGALDDRGTDIAIDNSGNAYVTGWTSSFDFPVVVGPDLGFNNFTEGTDAFVAKVNASGTGLVYCGYIGGASNDVASGIAVDGSGNAYVTGWTFSMDFPTVVGPYLTPHANVSQYSEAFVTMVNASGTGLVYSGFIGGSLGDQATGIAVDSSGSAYIAGWTESEDFPAVSGPDLSFNGTQDAFVAKLSASGEALVYSGFIGGLASDYGAGIAVDSAGNAYVTGSTNSYPTENFPLKVGPSLTYRGGGDAFVTKVNASGTGLVYCGYIGGTGDDTGAGIAVDSSANAYVTGTTDSGSQFPVKGGPDLVHNGGNDAFVAKVAASGAELNYCGFIGGSGDDRGQAIAVDGAGDAYVAGLTDSASDFPVSGGPYLVLAGLRDAFLATVRPSGASLIYSGYLGGSQNDEAAGVSADGTGKVFIAGYTRSNDFPVLVGPFTIPGADPPGSSDDAFVARIFEELPPAAPADLHATAVTASEIGLAWTDKSTNEDGFKIERKTGETGSWSQIDTVGANVTVYDDTGLTEGTTYFYRVRAYNNIGDSDYSNEAGIAILTRPAAPTDLTAEAINERQVDLAWTDHSGSESGFRIERKVNAGDPWASVGTVAANVTSFSDTNVVETTTYTYRVLAFNSGGDSLPSNEAQATTPALTIPVAPSGLQAAALDASRVRLTWVDNSYNEDGFKVERKTGAGGVWAQIGTAGADATSFEDSGLTESTTYYYRVRATNGAGDSAYSNEAPVTTPAAQPVLRLPINDIDFDNVNECAFLERTTVLYNDGGAPLTVTGVVLASGSGDFTYRGPATPFNIPPIASREITVRFAPSMTGAAAGAFAVSSNDPVNGNAPFNVSGTGVIPTIGLSLQVQRQTERAWIIQRQYGRITLTVTKSAPFNVTTYRLSRREGTTGTYQVLKDFTEAHLVSGTLTYIDMFLTSGTSYTYKVEALDCGGRVIATSNEPGALPPLKQPLTKRAIRTTKRGIL